MFVACNYIPRPVINGFQLTDKERMEFFDYVDWDAVLDGTDSFTCVRYRGSLYDLSEFEIAPDNLKALGFDGVLPQSNFDAIVVQYFDREGNCLTDNDEIIVGHAQW